MILVGAALLAALLFTPARAVPDAIPLPEVDRVEQRRVRVEDDLLAEAAQREPLAFEVRAMGEHFRGYGKATHAGDPGHAADAREKLGALLRRSTDTDALRRLRAYQLRAFSIAVATWEATGTETIDLIELGGDFLARARGNGWVAGSRVLLDDDERRTLFKVRWAQIADSLREGPLSPTANEWRAYYRLLLEHPEGGTTPRAAADRRRLAYLDAVERFSPNYPAVAARGMLLHRTGAHAAAVEAFRAHLARHPTGEWNLRVQNHLADAVARQREAEPE